MFLWCSDVDPHVPKRRVDETAEVFGRMGAALTKRIYPGLGRTIDADEIAMVRAMAET